MFNLPEIRHSFDWLLLTVILGSLTQNQIPEYRTFYINYNDLKKKIKILANFKRTSANTPSLSEFLNDLDKNVDKVDGFYSKQISEFEQKLESFKIKYEAYIKQREFNTGTYYLDEDDLLGALVGLRSQLQKLSVGITFLYFYN